VPVAIGGSGLWRLCFSHGVKAVAGLLFLLTLCATVAEAQHGKIDRLVFRNGDQVTCEVLELERGRIRVKITGMGTISIDWPEVVQLVSPARYEVELTTGERRYGALLTAPTGSLRVGLDANAPTVDLTLVVAIVPIEAGFLRRLQGSVGAGFNYAQANHRTQWNADGNLKFRSPSWFTKTSVSYQQNTEDDVDREQRLNITSSVQRYLARRWFLAMLAQFDRNETLGLSARWLGGGALGRTIVDTNRTRLSATTGLVYTEERYTESPKDDRVEVVFGSQLDWFTFGDRSTDFTTSALTFVDATRLNKVRVEVSGSMKFELVKDLDWTFTFFESFNSSPPAEGRRNDAGFGTTIAWSF